MAEFITVKEAKDYLGNQKANDDLIKIFMGAATQQIKSWCGWDIASANYQQFYDVPIRSEIISLRHMPVISISGASDDGTALTNGTDYTIDTRLGIIKFKALSASQSARRIGQWLGGYFTPGKDKFFANYTAGYEEIPDDIKLVTMKMVYKEFNERGGDLKSVSSATLSYTRPEMKLGMLPEWEAILTNYKQIS